MTFLAVRKDAADELIAARQLQSADFETGKQLATFIRTRSHNPAYTRLGVWKSNSGCIIYGRNYEENRYVVFDYEQSGVFENATDHQIVLYLQRILRFSIKYWSKSILTPTEKIINAKTAAIFPYPISQKTGIRITVDLNPDVDRLSKRGRSGRYLLVHKIGTDIGEGPNSVPNLRTFRKFLTDVEIFEREQLEVTETGKPTSDLGNFSSTTLLEPSSKVDIHQGYNTWMQLLTDDQRRFVLSPIDHPVRIEGPAGTGKTASLAVAAIHAMKVAENENRELQAIFITHSEASKNSITVILEAMDGQNYLARQATTRRIRVETLQGYCANLLRQDLSETEFVDVDAYDAKHLQLMYIEEAYQKAKRNKYTFERFFSDDFKDYIEHEEINTQLMLIQHEISVVIKGRSKENFDIYKKILPIKNGLPTESEGDKAFIWEIYREYREQLIAGGQFDTDDVVLTALSQLSTPIWRRRREHDGFDVIFVDETHLFNMNELSIFHHLTRSDSYYPIAFAVDRAQAIGDQGWADDIDVETLMPSEKDRTESSTVSVKGVFRCSPDIISLAFSITSSGASLFTNFQDPMQLTYSNMTYEEEKKTKKPSYSEYATDNDMVADVYNSADQMRESLSCSRGDIAIVAFSEELFRELEKVAEQSNKPIEMIKKRGDYEIARRAKTNGRYVLTMPDYVGGLEFDGVLLAGVDGGRVPASSESLYSQSKAYLSFAAHNRLYVSVTRARYQVQILGIRPRGTSPILEAAFAAECIDRVSK